MSTELSVAKSAFRADINGLRGYAVLTVVLFHFGVAGFDGGFVGVDIFFVISGFLMTSIIVGRLNQQRFSLLGFYLSRAQRILPALIVLCGLLIFLGWYILPAPEYERLAAHVAYSLTFLSNIEYYLEAGYFDVESEQKWLLHTWSLSLEWQFYMLLPLILWGLSALRLSRWTLIGIFVLGTLASLCASVFLTDKNPSMAFYLLHTRAWELLFGGLLVFAPRIREIEARWLEWFGFALMGYAVLFMDENSSWPGWRALFPVVGASCVLVARRQQSLLTNNVLMQWLGGSSYSIYLYHWPVVVFLGYLTVLEVHLWLWLGVVTSVLLGWLSFNLVENTSRRWLSHRRLISSFVKLAVPAAVVLAAAVCVHRLQGANWRLPDAVELIAAEAENGNPRNECHVNRGASSPSCRYGGDQIGAVIVGDSHADAVVNALAVAAPEGTGVIQWTYSACKTMEGVVMTSHPHDPSTYDCKAFNHWVMNEVKAQGVTNVPLVIVNRSTSGLGRPGDILRGLDARKPGFHFGEPYNTADMAFLKDVQEKMVETSCKFAQFRPLYLMRPIPEMPANVPITMSRWLAMGKKGEISLDLDAYRQHHAFIWSVQDEIAARCGAKILDPLPYLCDAERCYGSKNDIPLYFDDDHLSEYGNRLLVEMFREVFAPAVSHKQLSQFE
ncbi:acyltransferase [Pseudomaricurvus alcaniphilus]|uniref:acyltransferase family protein n=1 Tax=Pseudomaricurvus alcaniphilus TaxID=1166482 RepID=UPI00140E567E|nr:acyltransferase family protein [Pseudomaricurvus alcaniphilus]NHN36719.1 acyltransferase [Pseudomaricurvus alcaniphilus]